MTAQRLRIRLVPWLSAAAWLAGCNPSTPGSTGGDTEPLPGGDETPARAAGCEGCSEDAECVPEHRCAPVPGGASACLPTCDSAAPACPLGFTCTGTSPDAVCTPTAGGCCLDGAGIDCGGPCIDADHDGFGANCLDGPDCNDTSDLHHADCATCADADSDGRGTDCDLGVDCAEGNSSHWADCGNCVDADGDQHGTGCDLGTDCNDTNDTIFVSCPACIDADSDTYGTHCIPGPDCDDGDGQHWDDCGNCVDVDNDGRGDLCNLGQDCNDTNPAIWQGCPSCIDADGDGHGINCIPGLDCADDDPNNWVSCTTCIDADADLHLAGCDRYDTIARDCDDGDGDNWDSCAGCDDGDDDGYFSGCDAYVDHLGPDCNPQSSAHWLDCGGACTDADGDGFGVGCDQGTDCDDGDAHRWVWNPTQSACQASCTDADGDGYRANCDSYDGFPGQDCNDASAAHWEDCTRCIDLDGDGYGVNCDLGPDCVDLPSDPNSAAINPGAPEKCNGRDDDCDGAADNAPVTVMCGVPPGTPVTCQGTIPSCRLQCPTNYEDANGLFADGCECYSDQLAQPNTACGGAAVTVNPGETRLFTYNMVGTSTRYIELNFPPGPTRCMTSRRVEVTLIDNAGGQFAMKVYVTSCGNEASRNNGNAGTSTSCSGTGYSGWSFQDIGDDLIPESNAATLPDCRTSCGAHYRRSTLDFNPTCTVLNTIAWPQSVHVLVSRVSGKSCAPFTIRATYTP